MTDVTENDLRAALKALTDVIAPSIVADDPLAGEQLRLVVEYLEFLKSRVDFLADRDRFELAHNLKLARALGEDAAALDAACAERLAAAAAAGEKLIGAAGAPAAEMKRAAAVIAALLRDLIRRAQQGEADLRGRIERLVLEESRERIEFERAWFLPLGLDPAPGEVPPIAVAIEKSMKQAGR